jgi:uncharacterized cupredoxin-like copper-binding protein
MSRRSTMAGWVALTVAVIMLIDACSSPAATTSTSPPPSSASATHLDVVLKEFSIGVRPQQAKSGSLMFEVRNQGATTHEFDIYKSSLPLDNLPIDKSTNQVDENSPGVQSIELSPPIAPGTSAEMTATLPAGSYYFVCNKPGHYRQGMRFTYTVH